MATIRVTCNGNDGCGDVDLTSDDLVVRVCIDNGQGAYAFRCPECTTAISKPADNRVIELLIASGVRLDRWRLPAELREDKEGDPIDHDDLLDFHRLLTDEGRLTAEMDRLVDRDLSRDDLTEGGREDTIDPGDNPWGGINKA